MIRPYRPSDRAELARLLGENEIGFPSPEHPAVVDVLVDERDGRIVAALGAVHVLEGFLALDRDDGSSPRERLGRARSLIEAGAREAYGRGYRVIYTPVPRHFAGWFRKLLRLCGVIEETRFIGALNLKERFEWSL